MAEKQKRACHCINLRRANEAVTRYYDRHLAPCGLTVSQYSLLRNLARCEPASVSELAARVALDRTTLTRSLRPLAAAGYIEDSSPAGTRNRQLRLTPFGKKRLAKGVPLWERAQQGVEQALGRDNVSALSGILDILEGL